MKTSKKAKLRKLTKENMEAFSIRDCQVFIFNDPSWIKQSPAIREMMKGKQ